MLTEKTTQKSHTQREDNSVLEAENYHEIVKYTRCTLRSPPPKKLWCFLDKCFTQKLPSTSN